MDTTPQSPLPRWAPPPAVAQIPPKHWKGVQDADYYCIQTMDQFRRFYAELRQQKLIAVDTETSGLDWVRSHACGLVFGWGIRNNYYLPIAHKTGEVQLNLDDIRDPLRAVLEDTSVVKLFWNDVFDLHFLRKCGLEVLGPRHDGVPLVHLLDENTEKGLKEVATKFIDRHAGKWEKAVDKWRTEESKRRRTGFSQLLTSTLAKRRTELEAEFKAKEPMAQFVLKPAQLTKQLKDLLKEQMKDHPWYDSRKINVTYDQVPLDVLAPYAAADVHYTFMMYKELLAQIGPHDMLRKLYCNEMELSKALFEVEDGGVKVNIPYLRQLEPKFEKEIADLAEEIYESVGYRFNIDSNEELIAALRKAGVQLTKLTKGGEEKRRAGEPVGDHEYSVDKEVLEYLAAKYDFAEKIKDYREKQKLLNTYVRNIIEVVDAKHYLHSTFNANVSTGRMSSREPNVQNIPGKNMDIRKAFTVPEEIGAEGKGSDEYVFVFADYSQVELRLTAHWSTDPTLLSAYSDKYPGWIGKEQDVHTITLANVVLSRPLDEVIAILKDENHPDYKDVKWKRNIAKRVNFGIIYGAGPGAIQRQVSTPKRQVSVDECKYYIKKYFEKYQGVKRWIDNTEKRMTNDGFLINSFGRYRRLPKAQSSERWERQRAARQGVNFLIQGDAADLFKHAIVRVRRLLKQNNAKTRIVNFVHDEIQFYWHKKELGLMSEVRKVMEDFEFRIPILAEFAWSPLDWASKKELKH